MVACMSEPRRKPGKPGRKPTGRAEAVAVFVRISPALAAALERYRASLRPAPQKQEVFRVALEDFLASRGFWQLDQ